MEIDHSCPQCGAPIVLAETDRLLVCPFCRVRLFIRPSDFFRYVLPPAPSARGRAGMVYVPYGRFRGMVFDLRTPEVNERVLDTNFLKVPPGVFPATLGIRPQALRMRYAAFRDGDRCLAPAGGIEALPPLSAGLAPPPGPSPPTPSFKSIGEVRSLIYAPFYPIQGCWYDGIRDEPLPPSPSPAQETEFHWEEKRTTELLFIPTLCPDCGWDLSAAPESCRLFCPQCRSGWEPGPSGLRRFTFFMQPVAGDREAFFFLPFWRFRLPFDPPDYFRLPVEGLFQPEAGPPPSWEPRKTWSRFWVPAFKISPRIFLRLGCRMTEGAFPETELASDLPPAYHPVTLPADEALGGIEVIQAALTRDEIILPGARPRIDPPNWERDLVFLPFQETSYELIQPQIGIGIAKNVLNLGKWI